MRLPRILFALPLLLAAAPAGARMIPYAEPPPPRPYIPPTPEILYCDGYPTPPPRVIRLWGVGVRASALTPSQDGAADGRALGAVLRLRSGARTQLELDFGRASYAGDTIRETRLGASMYARLTDGKLAPYLLAGGGAWSRYAPDKDYGREMYIEAGGGLAFAASDRLEISGDVRWTALHWLDGDSTDAAADPVREARLAAIVWF